MTLRVKQYRAELAIRRGDDIYESLRLAASAKLQSYSEHRAGGGSLYIEVAGYKIRIANHENISFWSAPPDFNVVNRNLSDDEFARIVANLDYPRVVKKTAFAKHVGLTVPKLKKLLTPSCYEMIYEDELYPKTLTEYVVVSEALKLMEQAGVTKRIPVRQESYSVEDYCGY